VRDAVFISGLFGLFGFGIAISPRGERRLNILPIGSPRPAGIRQFTSEVSAPACYTPPEFRHEGRTKCSRASGHLTVNFRETMSHFSYGHAAIPCICGQLSNHGETRATHTLYLTTQICHCLG